MAFDPFDGPIPGENYTSDTKNYPWHRPPEVSDLDDAINLAAKRLMNEEVSPKILGMIDMGIPLVKIADIFATGGIMNGKWSVDMAIMLAGPITHIIKLMADGYGIDYDIGLDSGRKTPRGKAFNGMLRDIHSRKEVLSEVTKEIPEIQAQAEEANLEQGPAKGFMAQNPMMQKEMIKQEGTNPVADTEV